MAENFKKWVSLKHTVGQWSTTKHFFLFLALCCVLSLRWGNQLLFIHRDVGNLGKGPKNCVKCQLTWFNFTKSQILPILINIYIFFLYKTRGFSWILLCQKVDLALGFLYWVPQILLLIFFVIFKSLLNTYMFNYFPCRTKWQRTNMELLEVHHRPRWQGSPCIWT